MRSVREKLEKIITRIDTGFSKANVFTKTYLDKARAEADAADSRKYAGLSLGPLDGTIVSIKDLFDIKGEVTTAGAKALRGAPLAREDALIVTRLRRAGAVIIGKTNMSEFAFTGLGLNSYFGTPGNAVDPARIPGGSSSGAAVSVADDTSEISIGTDTGGSVRIPAALNGIVGFKPSTGRVPTDGAYALSYSLDSIGPLARTVQQCADADAVMSGIEPGIVEAASLSGLRVAVPRGYLLKKAETVIADAFEKSVHRLSQAGAKIFDISIDDLLDAQREAVSPGSIASIEGAVVHGNLLDDRADDYELLTREQLLEGREVSAVAYIRMMRRRAELIGVMDRRLSEFDTLVLPTVQAVAPLTKRLQDDADEYKAMNALLLRNTAMGNFFDLTGITLPMQDLSQPAGFMMMARHGADKRLLSMAKSVDALFLELSF